MNVHKRTASCLLLIFCGLNSLPASATGIIQTLVGTVRAGPSEIAAQPATQGQALSPGTVVLTGPGSRATLRFDDGQAIVLHENSTFRVREYTFVQGAPQQDRFVFDFLRGAMRSVTAVLTRRNPNAYALNVPQATIGIRGTDFTVGLTQTSAFGGVRDGTITATNVGGGGTFGPGSFLTITSDTAAPVTIPFEALPANVQLAFSQLNALVIAGEVGANVAIGASTGGVSLGTAAAIAAGVAAAAAIGSGGDNNQQGATATATTTAPR